MARWTDPVDRQPGELPAVRRDPNGITYVIPVVLEPAKLRANLVMRRDDRGIWWASIPDTDKWQQ